MLLQTSQHQQWHQSVRGTFCAADIFATEPRQTQPEQLGLCPLPFDNT